MDQDPQNLTPAQLDPPFYNVMPKGKNIPAGFAAPKVVTTPAPASVGLAQSLPSRRSRKPLYIGVTALLILAIGGFIGYKLLFNAESQTADSSLVQNTEEQTPQTQPEGVSTPDEWQLQYFGEAICADVDACGDLADPDSDGLSNKEEFTAGTDPKNPDSDGDKLADGDEVHVFGGNPLQQRTAGSTTFTDADDARGGFDSRTGKKFTDARLLEIKEKIKQYSLHQPSITVLGNFAAERYNYGVSGSSQDTQLPPGTDISPQSILDRDTQRLSTIKKVGAALLKYKTAKSSFPTVTSFTEMSAAVRPYNLVATNYNDPINKGAYVYGYTPQSSGQDFSLSYYSETQKQLIRYGMKEAQRDLSTESANLNDQKRMQDLESLWMALLLYSSALSTSEGQYVFPTAAAYKTALMPNYISTIPKDPKTGKDYAYTVSAATDSFTLSAALESPVAGATQIFCTQEQECLTK
jgi:hypothetical protein